MRARCLALVTAGILWCLAGPAHADPRADIAAKARSAMASYDAMDYDAARRQLNQALAIAKRSRLDRDPVVARVYLDLGIAQLAGSDQEAARQSFLAAVQIDPKIVIDPGYKTSELVKMLDEARAQARKGGGGGGGGDDLDEPEVPVGVDCRAVHGLQHTVIESAAPGRAQTIEAFIGYELSPVKVVVMYRPEGAIDFTEARLGKQAGCRYTGTIPGSAMRGALVHYYVAAYDANNKPIAAKGTSGAPNIIELGGASRPPRDRELEGPAEAPARRTAARGGGDAEVGLASHAEPSEPAKSSTIELSLALGTSLGYVSGTTEGGNKVQTCCIGTSLLVVTPELSYMATRQLALGLVFRLGIPVGANIDGHAATAPAGFVRVRYAFAPSGDGFHIRGEAGIGVLRNTLKIDAMDMPGMDTDEVAQGPLLLGLGLGYKKKLGGPVSFLIDLDAISGIAITDKLGGLNHLNTGISGDLSLGLAFGF
ncbi:MAG TPA: tetratricopeptide repeat protein [Kofleriaceae bacterium]|nr:tetratricopeptide repeat protein [Kofleriaceae bacterium]